MLGMVMNTHGPRPFAALLLVAGGMLLLPASARAGYVFQNVINTGDVNFNQELAINNSGVIAGYFGDGTVVFNNGYTVVPPYGTSNFTAENFPSSMEVQTQVTGINNLGNTVGFWIDTSGANHGFTDFGGAFTSVDDPSSTASPIFTQFLGVNDSDEVAGFYVDAAGNSHAFTYSGTTFTPIMPSDATMATATDLNNSGEVSGFFTSSLNGDTYGFLDSGGVISDFLYPGSTFTQFLGLNNNGLVVGVYMDSAGNNNGFVYNTVTNTWQTVDDPFAATGAGNGTTINGLNDNGQLVGFYVNAAGQTVGLLANPTPEPASLALVGLGALVVVWRRRATRA
jgi:PEP-CTERM motif